MKTIVISGFPGIGKTEAAKRIPDCLDLESRHFDKDDLNWVSAYVDGIENGLVKYEGCYRYIFISSHREVRQEMKKRRIPYIVVVPYVDDKEDYLKRYLRRGNDMDFIDNIAFNWYQWLDEINENETRVIHLLTVEYLSDILYMGD